MAGVSREYIHNMRIHSQTSELKKSLPFWLEIQKVASDSIVQTMIERHDCVYQLSGKERLAYNIVNDHYQKKQSSQVKLIRTDQGGSSKSYAINALKSVPKEQYIVTSFFGITSFNIGGVTFVAY